MQPRITVTITALGALLMATAATIRAARRCRATTARLDVMERRLAATEEAGWWSGPLDGLDVDAPGRPAVVQHTQQPQAGQDL